jgi:hypothetical protein
MMQNMGIRAPKPKNWIGFRPKRSMAKNDAKYPGMSPVARTRLPMQSLVRLFTMEVCAEVATLFPSMSGANTLVLRPRP